MAYGIFICAKYFIYIAALYAVGHVLVKHERKHHIRHIIIILGSAFLAWGVALFFKDALAHPRPDMIASLISPDDPYSFPSGHATFMFALAFSMYGFDKKPAHILFALAVITGAARVLSSVHYWYDILGGFVIGAGVASIVYILVRNLSHRR